MYYSAEDRVDFRELVKNLAKEFQTRIEMRQIGVRDEAKLLADYGDCGKPVCCNTHLSEMPPVSMRMAKLQKATLDPSKISGRCGRLKCCLRYEYDTYQELQKDLPPVGSEIITNKGRARVLAQEILAGQLLVETEDMRRLAIDAADVMTVLKRGQGPRQARRRRRRRRRSDGSRRSEHDIPTALVDARGRRFRREYDAGHAAVRKTITARRAARSAPLQDIGLRPIIELTPDRTSRRFKQPTRPRFISTSAASTEKIMLDPASSHRRAAAPRSALPLRRLRVRVRSAALRPGEDGPGRREASPTPTTPKDEPERHVTGQQLCEAMRRYAHEQYGRLAKQVLNHWGITSTGDFGEIVFNLIEIGQMRKTPDDRREDFDDVFDFDEAFEHGFQIQPVDSEETQ